MTQLELAFADITAILNQLGLSYAVGGSFASSMYGEPRSTLDVDLVVDLSPAQAFDLATLGSKKFAVDPISAQEAIAARRSFNMLHMAAIYKFDIFPATFFAHGHEEVRRRIFVSGTPLSPSSEVPLLSPEDVVLAKLAWYRLGNDSSERQWNDLQGIWKLRGDQLDLPYLEAWAQKMNTSDLLKRLIG